MLRVFVMDCCEPAISIAHDIDLTLDLSSVLMLMLMFITLIEFVMHIFLIFRDWLGRRFLSTSGWSRLEESAVFIFSSLPRTNPMSSVTVHGEITSPVQDEPWSTALSSAVVGITAPALKVWEAVGYWWFEQLVCSMMQLPMVRQWIIVWTCTSSCTWHRLSDLFCETTLLFHFSLFLISIFLFTLYHWNAQYTFSLAIARGLTCVLAHHWIECPVFVSCILCPFFCHSTFEMLTAHAECHLARSFACVSVLHCWGVCLSLLYCVKCIVLVMWYRAFTDLELQLANVGSECWASILRSVYWCWDAVLDLTELVFFDVGMFYWDVIGWYWYIRVQERYVFYHRVGGTPLLLSI